MNKDPFKEYIKQTEPGKREKGYAWHTAIGLQAPLTLPMPFTLVSATPW